ncbi:MAG: DUF3857 domain-containing protein [candidate division Zixibacteria bacterium]|nr:DUF3857 domain-containing protein [candidate division Zixibacteria bacterium]
MIRFGAVVLLALLILTHWIDKTVAQEYSEINTAAVVQSEDISFDILKNDRAIYTVHRKIKVFNSEGQFHGGIQLLDSEFMKLKSFTGLMYNSNGDTIVTIEKKDGLKTCGFSAFSFFDKDCSWFYYLTSQDYPYTIEYSYKIETKSLFFWPEWHPQRSIPVKQSKYTLSTPKEFEYISQVKGNIPPPEQISNKGREIVIYEVTDIMPLKEEMYPYNIELFTIGVKFAANEYQLDKYRFAGGSWKTFGNDYYKMVDNCFALNNEQKKLIEHLKSEYQDEKLICEKLHEELRSGIRYVAIQIGIGGWRPSLSKHVFERGYGDCKDLSTLYVSMLNYIGIKANLAAIMTKGKGITDPSFPSLYFNHVIFFTIIDNDTIWSDPTCSYCHIGDLPWWDENVYVLAIDSTDSKIVQTAASTAEDNYCIRNIEINIHKNRSVNVSYKLSGTGNIEYRIKSLLHHSNTDKIKSFLQEGDFQLSKKVKFDSVIVSDNNHPTIFATSRIRNAIQSTDNKKYLTFIFCSTFRERECVKLTDRVFPLDLRNPITYADSIIINIPPEWKISQLPDPVNYVDEFGSLKINCTLTESQIIVSRIRQSFKYYISTDMLSAFNTHLKTIDELMIDYIAFIPQ